MTITSNIHYNLAGWGGSTSYIVGNRVSNTGNAYQCIQSGTSALIGTGGPTGQSSNITDGTVIWKYLSSIDYTSIQAWNNAWPSTLTDYLVGLLWNNGSITTTVVSGFGVPFLSTSGHTMGSYTATLMPAPGEGYRDTLLKKNGPLQFNTSYGVNFVFPSSTGNVNYFNINDNNFIFDGIQCQDPLSTSVCTHFAQGSSSANVTVKNCLFDGYAQAGGADIVDGGGTGFKLQNTVIIDRQSSNYIATRFKNDAIVINCLMFGFATGQTGTTAIVGNSTTTSAVLVRNSMSAGYVNGIFGNSSAAVGGVVDHCMTDANIIGYTYTDGGSNIVNITGANQVRNSTTDFRISPTSPGLNKAVIDATNLPSQKDLIGNARGQGGIAWDIGPTEYIRSNFDSETFKSFII